MGVVNATPDSFSDGGRCLDLPVALAHARKLIADGANILDIGGESTRPGATSVSEDEEIGRVVPLIAALRAETAVSLSIDTMKPAVAKAAVAAGASLWNDVTALSWAPDSVNVAADLGCQVVLMHMQGDPQTMQAAPRYGDVVAEVSAYLADRAHGAMAAGITRERIWLDPGIGFGKSIAHNLTLIANLDRIVSLGFPVVLGASRKGFIGKIDALSTGVTDRLGGSVAIALAGAQAGAAAVRVHDVRETVQALKLQTAIDAARQAHASA